MDGSVDKGKDENELYNWRASEASELLLGVYRFELVWCMYNIYMYMYRGTCSIIVAHATHT